MVVVSNSKYSSAAIYEIVHQMFHVN